MSHATTFVSTLANVLQVMVDKRARNPKIRKQFRVALHRLTRFDGQEVFQQITPYAGRVTKKSGLGRYFSVQTGIVGLACKTGSLVVATRKTKKKFDRIWELTTLKQGGAKQIRPYVNSLLACPFFAPERSSHDHYVSLVLFADSADAKLFDQQVRDTIAAACTGFVNILEQLQHTGALRPIINFYPGFKVKRGSKNSRVIGELKRLGVEFTDSTDRHWKAGLTFRNVGVLDFEIGRYMKAP